MGGGKAVERRMKEILLSGFRALDVPGGEAEAETLARYHVLLEEKNRVMNLTAIRGETDTANLHFLDSAALLRYLDVGGKTLLDVGSGAGFPGMVLKILCPSCEVTLLDSQRKRTLFLEETARELGLGVQCLTGRAEEQKALRESFDFAVSRAVARLNILSELCLPFIKVGGTFAAMKGPAPEEELKEAERGIRLLGGGKARVERYTIPGTDVTHSVVLVEKVKPTPSAYPRRFAVIGKAPL